MGFKNAEIESSGIFKVKFKDKRGFKFIPWWAYALVGLVAIVNIGVALVGVWLLLWGLVLTFQVGVSLLSVVLTTIGAALVGAFIKSS